MKTALVRPAWLWDCPHCGREQCNPRIMRPANQLERSAALASAGATEDDMQGHAALATLAPLAARCGHCATVFHTEHNPEHRGVLIEPRKGGMAICLGCESKLVVRYMRKETPDEGEGEATLIVPNKLKCKICGYKNQLRGGGI